MLSAWLSAVSKSFDCSTCKRKNFVCPMLNHIKPLDLEDRIKKADLPSSMPLVFKYESVGVCPRIGLTPFASMVTSAYNWWEKGQLGVNFLDAPAWVESAFITLSNERAKASEFVRKQNK